MQWLHAMAPCNRLTLPSPPSYNPDCSADVSVRVFSCRRSLRLCLWVGIRTVRLLRSHRPDFALLAKSVAEKIRFWNLTQEHDPGILKELSIHMKRTLVLTAFLATGIGLALVPGAAAQTTPAPATAAAPAGPTKIAVIGFQAAVARTNEGKRNFADLQKKYLPRENELKSRNDEIENLTKQLQTQSASLSDAARATQARTIDEKKKRLDRDAEDLRTTGGQEAQEMYNTLASKVYDVLSNYAQQQGYSVVLDVSQQQSPILYAVQGTDITQAIIDAYNLKSGVPAPPPGSEPAAAPSTAAPRAPAAH